MTSDFAAWLQNELESRKMKAADLARITRKDQGIFSRILGRKRQPDPETILSISHALRLPADMVFRAAGLLPRQPDLNEEAEQIMYEVAKLPKDDQEEVLAFIRMKNNLRKKK